MAALNAAALQAKIIELGDAIANGMDPTEALNRLQSFQDGLDARDFRVSIGLDAAPIQKDSAKIKEAVMPTINDIETAVGDLGLEFVDMVETASGQFMALDDDLADSHGKFADFNFTVETIRSNLGTLTERPWVIRIEYQTTGTPPPVAPPTTPPAPPPGGAPPFATGTGGQFLSVPPGYPNDSYPIRLQSGEDFMVITPQDRAKNVGGYSGNSSGTVNNFYITNPDPRQVASEVSAILARQTRLNAAARV